MFDKSAFLYQALWDTLLDIRIRLQKAVVASNNLPLVFYSLSKLSTPADFVFQPPQMEELLHLPACRDALNKVLEESLLLADELFDLEEVGLPVLYFSCVAQFARLAFIDDQRDYNTASSKTTKIGVI